MAQDIADGIALGQTKTLSREQIKLVTYERASHQKGKGTGEISEAAHTSTGNLSVNGKPMHQHLIQRYNRLPDNDPVNTVSARSLNRNSHTVLVPVTYNDFDEALKKTRPGKKEPTLKGYQEEICRAAMAIGPNDPCAAQEGKKLHAMAMSYAARCNATLRARFQAKKAKDPEDAYHWDEMITYTEQHDIALVKASDTGDAFTQTNLSNTAKTLADANRKLDGAPSSKATGGGDKNPPKA